MMGNNMAHDSRKRSRANLELSISSLSWKNMMLGLACDDLRSRTNRLRRPLLVSPCLEAVQGTLKDARMDERLVVVDTSIRGSGAAACFAQARVCRSGWLAQSSTSRN